MLTTGVLMHIFWHVHVCSIGPPAAAICVSVYVVHIFQSLSNR